MSRGETNWSNAGGVRWIALRSATGSGGRDRAVVPLVLVDGMPADYCHVDPVTEAGLRAAGIGAP